jgi:hypothetical protein
MWLLLRKLEARVGPMQALGDNMERLQLFLMAGRTCIEE